MPSPLTPEGRKRYVAAPPPQAHRPFKTAPAPGTRVKIIEYDYSGSELPPIWRLATIVPHPEDSKPWFMDQDAWDRSFVHLVIDGEALVESFYVDGLYDPNDKTSPVQRP